MSFPSLRTRIGLGLAAALVAGAIAAPAHAEPSYQLHGYLSQGYAISTDYELLGIPTAGTTDWRRAALQFRMLPNDQDQLVIQLRERRLGTSPVNELGDETISLDWGFVQRSFGDYKARVGRMPIHRGIYNQIRDVGVINPFYRAPYMFYTESFETIEGGQVDGRKEFGSGWSGEAALFGGETFYSDVNPTNASELVQLRAQRVFGAQVWLTTPLQGARVGANHISFAMNQTKLDLSQYSLDGNFEKFLLRAEYGYLGSSIIRNTSFYGQAGVQLHPKVWVYGMYEATRSQVWVPGLPSPPFPPAIPPYWSPEYDMSKDLAGSIVLKPNSSLALKFEAHNNEGYNYPQPFQPFPIQPPGYPVFVPADDPLKTTYMIASISIAY